MRQCFQLHSSQRPLCSRGEEDSCTCACAGVRLGDSFLRSFHKHTQIPSCVRACMHPAGAAAGGNTYILTMSYHATVISYRAGRLIFYTYVLTHVRNRTYMLTCVQTHMQKCRGQCVWMLLGFSFGRVLVAGGTRIRAVRALRQAGSKGRCQRETESPSLGLRS